MSVVDAVRDEGFGMRRPAIEPALSGEVTADWTLTQDGEPNLEGREWSYSLFRGTDLEWQAYSTRVFGKDPGQPNIIVLGIRYGSKPKGNNGFGYEMEDESGISAADERLYAALREKLPEEARVDDRTRHTEPES